MWFLLVGVVACGDNPSKLPPSISLDRSSITVKAGETLDVAASYEDSDGVVSPATDATFTISGSTVATVTAGTNGHATIRGVAEGRTVLTIAGRGASASFPVMVTAAPVATLDSIEVTPAGRTIAAGTAQQMTATGLFSDGTKKDLTAEVTWSSSADATATVSAAGEVKGIAVGTATIKATKGALSGMVQITISDAELESITVTPANPSVTIGLTQQFKATGKFSNQTEQDLTTQVDWSSSAAGVAAISNAAGTQGLATGVAVGTATIKATKGTVSGETGITVTDAVLTAIAVTPDGASIAKGTSRQFVATGTFNNATTQVLTDQVTWTSSDGAVASISNDAANKGEAKGLLAGDTTITATLGAISGAAALTVSDEVLVSLEVAPATVSEAIGHTVAFRATGTFSDDSTQDLTAEVVWSTSDAAIASVSNAADAGVATAIAVGTATITATSGAITDSGEFTVTPAVVDSITVAPATASIIPGRTQAFTATGNLSDGTTRNLTATATWTSSAAAVASIAATGIATGLTVGTTTITATSDGKSGTATLNVLGPSVTETLPRDGAFGIRTSTPIIVTFDQAVAAGSVTVQGSVGACSGSLQVSSDNFASCIRFVGGVSVDGSAKIVTATPATLSASTTYKIRITSAVTNTVGGAAVPFTQATGFTTSAAGNCASGLVISQVYGAGGNVGAVLRNDFIELHNGGPTAVSLAGLAVQYAGATGSSWQVTALPAVSVPAGGYYLIAEGGNGAVGDPLPTPDLVPASLIPMGGSNGKVALTSFTTPLTGACPLGLTNDFVGYGSQTLANGGCFEGGNPTAATSATLSATRNTAGCTDSNDNKNDFTALAPNPRNAATAPSVCACFATFEGDEPAMSFLSED